MMNKLKKINLKHVIKVFTLIWGLLLIVFMTMANIGLSDKFNFLEWLGNTLILFGIMVFGLLMGESMGEDKQKEKVGGLYQEKLTEYNLKRAEIEPNLCYFNQFFDIFSPKELYRKKFEYLTNHGVGTNKAERIIKYCTIDDFVALKEHVIDVTDENGNTIQIRKLLPDEVEPVYKVLKGDIKLQAQGPAYFLSAFATKTTKSILEMGGYLEEQIKENKKWNRVIKIVSSLVISLVWALFTVKEFMDGNDAQAWINLITRVTALITSLLSGWLSSVITVKLLAEILEYKKLVLVEFITSIEHKLFIPKTEDELAKEESEQYKKEQEEAIDNVIDPEPEQLLPTHI